MSKGNEDFRPAFIAWLMVALLLILELMGVTGIFDATLLAAQGITMIGRNYE